MLYAAFGSNLHPVRLGLRTPSSRLIGTSRLPDWALHFHKRSVDGSGKCSISPGGTGVWLAIYDMSTEDKLVLDDIEGVGRGYEEIKLALPEFGRCWTYVAQASHIDEALSPYDWYSDLVLAGAGSLGFPEDYIRQSLVVETQPDPDSERRAANLKILAQLHR